jgi:antitoxin (DNA-binding transcriptional repressor) of toxin-antitoxin stability system
MMVCMRVAITKFRQELFQLVERALKGEPLEFTHKGFVFKVVPDIKPSRLAALTGQTVVAQRTDLEQASRELLREMESEWEKDWSEL